MKVTSLPTSHPGCISRPSEQQAWVERGTQHGSFTDIFKQIESSSNSILRIESYVVCTHLIFNDIQLYLIFGLNFLVAGGLIYSDPPTHTRRARRPPQKHAPQNTQPASFRLPAPSLSQLLPKYASACSPAIPSAARSQRTTLGRPLNSPKAVTSVPPQALASSPTASLPLGTGSCAGSCAGRIGLVWRPAQARVAAGTGSCARLQGLVCRPEWARVAAGTGSCAGRARVPVSTSSCACRRVSFAGMGSCFGRVSVAAAENGGNARRTHSRALLPRRGSATPAELATPLPRAAAGLGSFAGRAHVPVGSGRHRARVPAKEPRPAGTGSRTAWALLLIGLMSQRPACSGRHGLECRPGRARVAAGTGWCAGQHWLV